MNSNLATSVPSRLVQVFGWLMLGIILCLLQPRAQAASLLSNGNLEANTGGLPDSWTYTQADGLATVQIATNSPFTSIFAPGVSAARLTDGTSSGAGPFLIQSFASQSSTVYVYWDFFFNSPLTGNASIAQVDDTATVTTRFNMDDGGFFSVEQHTGSTFNVIPLTTNTWYHVALKLDIGSDTMSGDITPFGGSTSNFSGTLRINTPTVNRLVFGDFPSTASNATIIVDNFAVSTTAVPEPSTTLLAMLGAVGLALRLRRRTAR